jgi:5'-3' exoribonuclease 2
MNGIIHPCAHPEHGPAPKNEMEMYERVCQYIDRLIRVVRPRRLLYLAIDGVAPRAKMNQQRSRRFRSAQEARELAQLEEHVRNQLSSSSDKTTIPPKKQPTAAWDSNVITPGTPFMLALSEYIRFYVRKRMADDPAWKPLLVIFSDASIPGEGEHKIMAHVRLQRSQPGYDPNLVHVLHGLDADLIMLGLATHEAHFYISRERVLFGRKSEEVLEQRQLESGFTQAQRQLDEQGDMTLPENQFTPLQRVSIPILREYLAAEFQDLLQYNTLGFAPDFERLIDDIVFLCFFVGNDFLPHLPSLDIRDGALDFLFNVYRRVLPTLGDYITKSGGNIQLSHVDIILAEVGSIEDYVFAMKYENEQRQKQQRLQQKQQKSGNSRNDAPPLVVQPSSEPPPKVRGRAARILEKNESGIVAVSSSFNNNNKRKQHGGTTMIQVSHGKKKMNRTREENVAAAQAIQQTLLAQQEPGGETIPPTTTTTKSIANRDDGDNDDSSKQITEGNYDNDQDGMDHDLVNGSQDTTHDQAGNTATDEKNISTVDTATIKNESTGKKEAGVVGDIMEEFDADDDDDEIVEEDDDLDAELPVVDDVDETANPEAARLFKEKVKEAQQKKLDEYAEKVEDKVRLHEAGWKDRYYSDKCKADDVKNHGGREHLFRSYVVGLCWVMKYYYDGCPSWKWYYPFHYGPFASDLKNIERFAKDCKSFELSTPFNPIEQLMAVLPSDSSHAIPKASRWLMLDLESPIIDFYPKEVPVDPNGKAMPWLWVVLLPFIDEDRLLAALSPTMTQWTKDELLCNARGLDDGYLYVHREHSLARKFAIVLQHGKTAKDPKTKLSDAASYGCPGFSGLVRPPLSNELYPVDEETTVKPPATAADKITDGDSIFADDIEPNVSACVSFSEPPKLSHKSILLPGARLDPPILTTEDKRIRRPRLNRGGGSIANMGVSNGQSYKSGYGSMNVGSYERNLANQTGRGGDMYQTGNRAWGAMEPVPKRPRHVIPPQVNNPFMNLGHSNSQPGRYQPSQNQWKGGQPQQQQQYQYQQQMQYSQQPPPYQPSNYPSHQSYSNQQQGSQSFAHQGYSNQPGRGNFSRVPPPPLRSSAPPPPPPTHSNISASYNRHQIRQPPQPQGYNFRAHNQSQSNAYQRGPNGQHQAQPPRSRASADVMNNLRAQLKGTLNQHRNQQNR